ncbi:MAG: ABC transporter substrate-binding protein [Colwellia sp.]|nr:ABC transporter substrate-binding protein [Colwellia sp.]MCW9081525.1 ABC transporter substrate-binding protein [Colwellia sp.]
MKVVLIYPIPAHYAEFPLWKLTTNLVQAAAKNLNVDLTIIYGGSHRFAYLETIKSLNKKTNGADYIIFHPQQGITTRQFSKLESLKVPFICLENNIGAKEALAIGKPGVKYKFWLGGVYFDDVQAGTILANALIKENKRRLNEAASLIAISGNHAALSKKREKGLFNSQLQAESLNQVVHVKWSPQIAVNKVSSLLARHPHTNILWVASDLIALALLESNTIKKHPNKMVIGGIGGLPDAISSINNNGLTATAGGHFMQATMALIKAFDHHHGINSFSNSEQKLYPFSIITKENVKSYLPLSQSPHWDNVNFSQFSQYLTPQNKQPLTLEYLLKSLSE